jgi:hypothetical protein
MEKIRIKIYDEIRVLIKFTRAFPPQPSLKLKLIMSYLKSGLNCINTG